MVQFSSVLQVEKTWDLFGMNAMRRAVIRAFSGRTKDKHHI